MSKNKTSQPSTSPQPAGGVDFLYRTMIEREATGKRRIRPKNVDDLDFLQSLQDESDDPDFDCKDEDSDSEGIIESEDEEGSNDSKSEGEDKGENAGDDSDESEDEDYDEEKDTARASDSGSESDAGSDSSSDDEEEEDEDDAESGNSDSDEPDTTKKSALRESLQKFEDETHTFMSKKPSKKKKKKPAKPGEKTAKKATSKNQTKSENQGSKSTAKGKKSSSKKSEKQQKQTKSKKTVVVKKSKVSSKKSSTEKKKKKKSDDKAEKPTIMSLLDGLDGNLKENRAKMVSAKPICSACLKDNSDDSNEIVECDSCGISVHETCYGLSADNVSISSGSGSSSCTEPWFCDACKSGAENISCELCPVEGGLFKESIAGRWVHLVCALYTPGVVVHHDSSINLYAIQYTRWGSHNCAACENERLAQTGIVISCDAGMCKTYFHATCAQKLGLLSDPIDLNQVDIQEADPYFVSCKMHTNREAMRRRIKLYNILQEQLRMKKSKKEAEGLPSGGSSDHARILRKLDKVRQKTAKKKGLYLQSLENVPPTSSSLIDQPMAIIGQRQNVPDSWVNKKQRMLHTSAKLGRDFLNKTKLMGDDVAAEELAVKNEKIVSNIKRKWNVLPAMSVEYASYYIDRERRISDLLEQHEKSVKDNHELMEKGATLTDALETHEVNQEAMAAENESVSKQLMSLANILKSFVPNDKQFASKLQSFVKVKDSPGTRRKSPSASKGDRKSPSPRRMSVTSGKRLPSRGKSAIIKVCDTCSKSDNQHLITICDKCKKNYHLGCLDPPLERMPKRTRLCGWICSDCGEAASENEGHVDTEAPRALRGRRKIHKPKKYRGSDDSDVEVKAEDQSELTTATVTKKPSPKSAVKVTNLPETKPSTEDLLGKLATPPPASTTATDRRRRSGSALSPTNGLNSLMSGPNSFIDLQSTSAAGLMPSPSFVQGPVVVGDKDVTPKKKKSSSPKKSARNQVDKVGVESASSSSGVISGVIKSPSPSPKSLKRKSDGPLTSYKVNGINVNDTTLPNAAKPKRPRKKKKEGVVLSAEDLSKNGMTLPDPSASDPGGSVSMVKVKAVKPKKPRVKKEKTTVGAVVVSQVPNSVDNPDAKPVKVKKPRKKKEPVPANVNGIYTSEGEAANVNDVTVESVKPKMKIKKRKSTAEVDLTPPGALAPVDVKPVKVKKPRKKKDSVDLNKPGDEGENSESPKKIKKKVYKPRTPSTTTPLVGVSAARKEESGVNEVMEKITTQIIAEKPKNMPNGTVKTTKKRKNSVGMVQPLTNVASPIIPDEKEKSVPPKKRKRAPSNAVVQQLHGGAEQSARNVDSIIQAVSCGDLSEVHLDNGDHHLKTTGVSAIMQGVVPRQIAPEHNIMQGKQMGSGVNSGEMVTVDASFLLDYSPPAESSYRTASVPTFYSSSNSNMNHGSLQKEGSLQSNSSSNSEQNVIRLQYIEDAPTSTVSLASAMPPPAPPASSPNMSSYSGVCATCTKTDSKVQLVMCDKCQLEFHFMCLNPPVKFNPRRKGHPWFCKNCDDMEPQENGILRHMQ